MEIIEKITKVDECYHACPFFQTEGNTIMSCGHPYWRSERVYDNLIITQDNSRGRVPDECPLRLDSIKMIQTIELK